MKKKVIVEPSETLFKLPEPLGAQFMGLSRRVEKRNIKIIDLGKISIDFPDKLKSLLRIDQSEIWGDAPRLADFELRLKKKIAEWIKNDYDISLDPAHEMLLTTGNTPGSFMTIMSLLDKNSRIFIPEPGYSLYRACALTAGAEIETYTVSELTDFQPNLEKIRSRMGQNTRAIVVNYPHNPTSKGVDLKTYDRLSEFASKNNIIVIADSVYLLHGGDGFSHPMYLQSNHGKATGIELITFSFLFNLPAFKIGVALGHRDFISPLRKFRMTFNQIPSVFDMEIADKLLDNREEVQNFFSQRFAENRKLVYDSLDKLGWEYLPSSYAPFVWIKLPHRRRVALTFCRMLLKRTGVIMLPGSFFGEEGEGYIRLALGQSSEKIEEAFKRIENYSKIYKVPKKMKSKRRADGGQD
jgi:LL-diaminopimelate aminotransferase